MQRILTTMVAVGLLAVSMPVEASGSVADRNVAFLLALAGLDEVPAGEGVVTAGGEAWTMSIADAFAAAAARAGGADLASLATGAGPAGVMGVGDIWLLEVGTGSCPDVTILGPQILPTATLVPQMYVYPGPFGSASSSGPGILIDWTTKGTMGGFYPAGATMAGQSDFWCFAFFGIYIWFPFLTGVAYAN